MSAPHSLPSDPLGTLRQYAGLAPWSLRDLAAMAGAILEVSAVFPVNAAARQLPTERTIRFYVARKLVSPPEGRGTAATYGYRHLLQVLAIKLQQMEGATLETLGREVSGTPGDVLERRVAGSLGPRLPPPGQLSLSSPAGGPRGKVGRALQSWVSPLVQRAPIDSNPARPRTWRRIPLGQGAELLVDDRHPLFGASDEGRIAAQFQRFTASGSDTDPSPSSS